MSDAVKAAPVKDTTVKPGDASTNSTTSTWSDIASRMWDSLKTDFTSTKPAGGGNEPHAGDAPASGAGGGVTSETNTKPPAAGGFALGDGRDPGKKSREDQQGFIHFGDILTGDGGVKLPPSDDRGVVSTGGKLNRDGSGRKVPRGDDDRGLDLGGKDLGDLTKPGRRGGDDRTMPTPGNEKEIPGLHKGSVPYFPERPSKPGTDQGKGRGTDQTTRVRPELNPLRGDRQTSKFGPHPESTLSEEPSAEDQAAASDIVHDADVSSMMGLDNLSQQAADAIIGGDFVELQTMLKDLEGSPNGAQQLNQMAKQLGNLLGTEVRPQISDDHKFGLDVMTDFSDNRKGCFPTGTTSESHLNIPSEGEMTASASRYWNSAFPRTASADPGVESTRLQALGTNSVLGLPEFLNNIDD